MRKAADGDGRRAKGQPDRLGHFINGLGRGGAGALLFGIPMLMTMEMWSLGFYIARERLLVLLIALLPLLVLLARRIGFERVSSWREAGRDAIVAYGIGISASAIVLLTLGLITGHMSAHEIVGKIAIQSAPASIGAMLGRSQLANRAGDGSGETEIETSYGGELLLMATGALFLSLNIAPTDEIMVLVYKMTLWHILAVALLSMALMHGFVYAVSFTGGHELSAGTPAWHAFVRFTLPGYVVALAVSFAALWIFERLDDRSALETLSCMIVLGFPAAIGAAAARLIL